MNKTERIKNKILKQVEKYYKEFHQNKKNDKINYAGRVFDEKEIKSLVESSLEFYLTSGKYCEQFENDLKNFLKIKHCLLVNSGSSANLLSFMVLTSPLLKERKINRGDEIITTACCFPTTVSPIIQYGAVPVFVDVELKTLNIDINEMKKALSLKTKAVMIAHTLGNPFNIKEVKKFCDKNNLWLIEDNCDSLGSKYNNQYTGTFGDIGTSSFFPAHHITTGEGGAVYTNNDLLFKIMKSMRDWGRDYKCNKCVSNCNKRYDENYDCRYTYSHFGYNLKMTDLQASIGIEQLKKINYFSYIRKINFSYLYNKLFKLYKYFYLPIMYEESDSCWFCFPIIIDENLSFKTIDLIKYLEKNNIETRRLFAGNILKQKCFSDLKKNIDFKVIGDLRNTNYIMKNTFFVGVYPNIKINELYYIYEKINEFIKKY